MTVLVPPTINADRSIKRDVVAIENQNVTMYCSADGSPPPSIYWKRLDDQVIITNEPVDGFGGELSIFQPQHII